MNITLLYHNNIFFFRSRVYDLVYKRFLKLTAVIYISDTYPKKEISGFFLDEQTGTKENFSLGVILFVPLIIEPKYKERPATIRNTKIAIVGEKLVFKGFY